MQIGKARHLKTWENFGKIMNEDSRALKIYYEGKNPKFQDILYESKQPK